MTQARSKYRWVVLALAFLVLLTSFGIRLALSNASVPLGRQLQLSSTTVGAFVTAFYVGYVGANAIGGFITDKIGSSRAIAAALAALAACTFAFGWIDGAATGFAVQCAMGLSAGVYFSATTKLVGDWFPNSERGRAFGIIAMPSSLAVILANSLFPVIIAATSWQNLYRLMGGYVAVIALVCFLFLRDAPRQSEVAAQASPPDRQSIAVMLRDRNFILLALGGFGGIWATWGFAFWVNALLVKAHGLSNIEAGKVTAIFGLGALIAKPLYGLASDLLTIRRKYLVILCYAAFAAMLMVFGTADTSSLRIIAPILGITAFVYSPIQSAMLTEMVGTGRLGAAAGLMNAFWQLGAVIVPLAVGAAFEASGSFVVAFAVLAAGPILGVFCMLALPEPPRTARSRSGA